MRTNRLRTFRARLAIDGDAELRRALNDVVKLSERHPEQEQDHGDGVGDRHELMRFALHEFVVEADAQSGQRDRQQQQQRQPVALESLDGNLPGVCQPAAHHDHHARDDENGRPVQRVENDLRQHGVKRKLHDFEAEGENLVGVDAARLQSEMNPAKNKWKRHRKGEQAAPRHQHVPVTTRLAPVADEFLPEELDNEVASPTPSHKQSFAR